jgi:hypothetical protein
VQNSNSGLNWYTIISTSNLTTSPRVIDVNIYRTNPAFGLSFNANPVDDPANMVSIVGTGQIVFQNCSEAKFSGTVTPAGATAAVPFDLNLERLGGVQRCANDDVAQAEINKLVWRSAPGTLPADAYGEFGMRQHALSGNWTIGGARYQGLFADIDVSGGFPNIGWYTYSPITNPNAAGALPSPAQPRWFLLIRADQTLYPFNIIDPPEPLIPAAMRYAIYRSRGGSLFGASAGSNLPVGYVEIRPIATATGGPTSLDCNSMQMIYKFASGSAAAPVFPPDPAGVSPATVPIPIKPAATPMYTVDEEFAGLTGVYTLNRLLTRIPGYCYEKRVP